MRILITFAALASLVFGATYKEGLKLFKSKDYKRAYIAFDEILFDNLGSVNTNYYLGRSAFEIGRYNEAIAAYERVLTINSNHHLSRLELARTYFVLGLYDQSQIEFETVKEKKRVPKEVKETVDKFLASIKDKKKKTKWSGTASIGLKYSDNVFQTKDDKKSSLAHVENLSLLSIYKDKEYTLKTGGGVYMENYTDEPSASFMYPYIFTGPLFSQEDYNIYIPVTASALRYDNEHILNSLSIKTDFSFKKKPEILPDSPLKKYRSFIEYSKAMYQKDKDKPKDSKTLKVGASAVHEIINSMLTYNLSYAMVRKERGSRYDIDHNQLEGGVNFFNTKLINRVILTGNGKLGLSYYNDKHLIEDKYREDKTFKIDVTGIYPIDKKHTITAMVGITKNRSNIDAYEYDKLETGINYIYNFSDKQLRSFYHTLGGEK